jgi:hypothetical protein
MRLDKALCDMLCQRIEERKTELAELQKDEEGLASAKRRFEGALAQAKGQRDKLVPSQLRELKDQNATMLSQLQHETKRAEVVHSLQHAFRTKTDQNRERQMEVEAHISAIRDQLGQLQATQAALRMTESSLDALDARLCQASISREVALGQLETTPDELDEDLTKLEETLVASKQGMRTHPAPTKRRRRPWPNADATPRKRTTRLSKWSYADAGASQSPEEPDTSWKHDATLVDAIDRGRKNKWRSGPEELEPSPSTPALH